MTVDRTSPLAATRRLGHTDVVVSPLCLGGNVFSWTADRDASFAVLDCVPHRGRQLHRHGGPVHRSGSRDMSAASRRRSSATGWPTAATATRSSSRPRWARRIVNQGLLRTRHPRTGRGLAAPTAHRPHRPVLRAPRRSRRRRSRRRSWRSTNWCGPARCGISPRRTSPPTACASPSTSPPPTAWRGMSPCRTTTTSWNAGPTSRTSRSSWPSADCPRCPSTAWRRAS